MVRACSSWNVLLAPSCCALLALVPLLAGCGAGRHAVTAAGAGAKLPRPRLAADAEHDSDSYPGEPDNDTNPIFGHAASRADARAADAVVARYYRALGSGDYRAACALMYSVFSEALPEEYAASAAGRRDSATCASVLAGMFRPSRARLRKESAALKVAAVRVRRSYASVRMRFGAGRATSYIELRRERGAWKVNDLIGQQRPITVE
jgi:hypothetical protein